MRMHKLANYRTMLRDQLSQRFGPNASIRDRLTQPTREMPFAYVDVQIMRASVDAVITGEAFSARQHGKANAVFSPHASIMFDPYLSQATLSKPWTRVAWTIEQAYADARAISEEVLRAGTLAR
jgi:hypothetical protein